MTLNKGSQSQLKLARINLNTSLVIITKRTLPFVTHPSLFTANFINFEDSLSKRCYRDVDDLSKP